MIVGRFALSNLFVFPYTINSDPLIVIIVQVSCPARPLNIKESLSSFAVLYIKLHTPPAPPHEFGPQYKYTVQNKKGKLFFQIIKINFFVYYK